MSFNYGKNIFSLAGGFGGETEIFIPNDSYYKSSLLYGREFGLSEKIFIHGFGGAGIFMYSIEEKRERIIRNTIGFPVGLKLRFNLPRIFSIGLHFQTNINSVETIFEMGIVLQWTRAPKL